MKKTVSLLLGLMLFASMLCGCVTVEPNLKPSPQGNPMVDPVVDAIKSRTPLVMNEPKYVGQNENDFPVFNLSWNEDKDIQGYQVAIMAEGEDPFGRGSFSVRNKLQISEVDGLKTNMDIILLDGVYTDTVTYRVKVRSMVDRDYLIRDPGEYPWSNIWEIKFVNGDYTIAATDADFDKEDADEKNETAKSEAEPEKDSKSESEDNTQPLPHSLPESFAEFFARERGSDTDIDLSKIKKLTAGVNRCEYGETPQKIEDEKVINDFIEVVSNMRVESKNLNEIASTGTYSYYLAADEEGNTLLFFAIQDGDLMMDRAMYSISGAQELENIEGIISPDDWDKYYEKYDSEKSRYMSEMDPVGKDIFDGAGYSSHLIKEKGFNDIECFGISIGKSVSKKSCLIKDSEEIDKLIKAMENVKIGEKEGSEPIGESWGIGIDYYDNERYLTDTSQLVFDGNRIKIGDFYYSLEGLEDLFDSVDNELLQYLKISAFSPIIEPKYY